MTARASGGRHYRGNAIDQNFDAYSVEYTFSDGTKLYMDGRNMIGAESNFASYLHGTKGCAVISEKGHSPSRARIYKGQHIHASSSRFSRSHPDLVWAYPQYPREPSPYDLEWDHLIEAIQRDTPYNEVDRGLKASLVTSMGRYAAHTGQAVTFDEMLAHDHEFSTISADLTMDSGSPLLPLADGSYPIPQPGILKDREYEYPDAGA